MHRIAGMASASAFRFAVSRGDRDAMRAAREQMIREFSGILIGRDIGLRSERAVNAVDLYITSTYGRRILNQAATGEK